MGKIKDLLLGREGLVGVTAKDNCWFIEAVLYSAMFDFSTIH